MIKNVLEDTDLSLLLIKVEFFFWFLRWHDYKKRRDVVRKRQGKDSNVKNQQAC